MRDITTKIEDSGSTPEGRHSAEEFNQVYDDSADAVSRVGITLDGSDTTQTSQAMFIGGSSASEFINTGSANALVLTPSRAENSHRLPPTIDDMHGIVVSCDITTENTGVSTLNIGQNSTSLLGSKRILTQGGNDVGPRYLRNRVYFRYDSTADSGSGAWIVININDGIDYVDTISDLRDRTDFSTPVWTMGYYLLGDNGGSGPWIHISGQSPGTYTDNGINIILTTDGDGSAAWTRSIKSINAAQAGLLPSRTASQNDERMTAALLLGLDIEFPYIGSGVYQFTSRHSVSSSICIKAVGRRGFGSVLMQWTGTGAKQIETRVTHPSDGTDAPISVSLAIESGNVTLDGVIIDLRTDYTDESPSNLGDDWDVGILVKSSPNFRMINLARVRGYWRVGGLVLDNTEDNGNCDGCALDGDVRLQGRYSLKLQGPMPESGQSEIQDGDLRGAGGISDFTATGAFLEGINHHSGTRPYDTDAGCYYTNGAVRPGTSQINAIQGHRFRACRFASYDPFLLDIRRSIRDSFIDCFVERITGKFQSDGTTPAGDSDVICRSTNDTKLLRLRSTDIYRSDVNFVRSNGFSILESYNQNLVKIDNLIPDNLNITDSSGEEVPLYSESEYIPSLGFVAATYNSRIANVARNGNHITIEIAIDVATLDTSDASQVSVRGIPSELVPSIFPKVAGSVSQAGSSLIDVSEVYNAVFINSSGDMQLQRPDGTAIAYNDTGIQSSGTLYLQLSYLI